MNQWTLVFYRDDQAASFEEAKAHGSMRKYPIDPPMEPISLEPMTAMGNPFTYGEIADLTDVINITADMMEHEAKIKFALECNDVQIIREDQFK